MTSVGLGMGRPKFKSHGVTMSQSLPQPDVPQPGCCEGTVGGRDKGAVEEAWDQKDINKVHKCKTRREGQYEQAA